MLYTTVTRSGKTVHVDTHFTADTAAATLKSWVESILQDPDPSEPLINFCEREKFILDLLNRYLTTSRLSESQEFWLIKKAHEITSQETNNATAANNAIFVGSSVNEMLKRRRQRTTARPTIVFDHTESNDTSRCTVKFALASERSKYAHKVIVTSDGDYDSNQFFGYIDDEGFFYPTKYATAVVQDTVRDFAADPAGYADAYGKLTGRCCFCRRKLTRSESVTAGYGPICAQNYDLPWGDEKTDDQVRAERAEVTR